MQYIHENIYIYIYIYIYIIPKNINSIISIYQIGFLIMNEIKTIHYIVRSNNMYVNELKIPQCSEITISYKFVHSISKNIVLLNNCASFLR